MTDTELDHARTIEGFRRLGLTADSPIRNANHAALIAETIAAIARQGWLPPPYQPPCGIDRDELSAVASVIERVNRDLDHSPTGEESSALRLIAGFDALMRYRGLS